LTRPTERGKVAGYWPKAHKPRPGVHPPAGTQNLSDYAAEAALPFANGCKGPGLPASGTGSRHRVEASTAL